MANNSCPGINTQILAAYWVIAPCYGCITPIAGAASNCPFIHRGLPEAAPYSSAYGGGLTHWKQILPTGS